MTRAGFVTELFLGMTAADGQTYVAWSRGSGAPSANAEIGSMYSDTASGLIYRKAVAGAGAGNWTLFVSAADLNSIAFKSQVKAATNETLSAGSRNLSTTPFTDDEGTTLAAADFAVNDFIISDVDGTPVMYKVSAVSAPSITIGLATGSEVLEQYDNYVVQHYLPDSGNAQEAQALVQYNGSAIIKIGDFNWSLATGINLNGYVESQGPISGTDSLQVVTEKTGGDVTDLVALSGEARGATTHPSFTGDIIPDSSTTKAALQALETELVDTRQNVDDLITLSGVAENATTLGTFTGEIIPDSQNNKQALQALETEVEGKTSVAAITTLTTIDSVLVDDKPGALWLVTAFEDATPANKQMFQVMAVHNGTASADATNTDFTVIGKLLDLGGSFNLGIDVDVNGTGASQTMRLRASSSTAGVTVTARRLSVY